MKENVSLLFLGELDRILIFPKDDTLKGVLR